MKRYKRSVWSMGCAIFYANTIIATHQWGMWWGALHGLVFGALCFGMGQREADCAWDMAIKDLEVGSVKIDNGKST